MYSRGVLRGCCRASTIRGASVANTVGRHGVFPYVFNSTLGLSNMGTFLGLLSRCAIVPSCNSRFNTGICGVTRSGRNGHLAFVGVANKDLGIHRVLRDRGGASTRGMGEVEVCSNRGFATIRRTITKAIYTMAKVAFASSNSNLNIRGGSKIPMLRPILACGIRLRSKASTRATLAGLGALRGRSPRLGII